MKKILVPIDGSDNSMKALMKAKEIATLTNGELTLLNVTEIPKHYVVDYDVRLYTPDVNVGKELLQSSVEKLAGFTGKVDTLHVVGDISSEIIRVAEDGDYDLVVMGSRGLGTFSRAILGSVSNKVLNHISKTVLIVK